MNTVKDRPTDYPTVHSLTHSLEFPAMYSFVLLYWSTVVHCSFDTKDGAMGWDGMGWG
jgi:hypothetical protein